MEMYLHSISESTALRDNWFQCAFPFFLTVCFYRIVEQGNEAMSLFFHIGCKGKNNNK